MSDELRPAPKRAGTTLRLGAIIPTVFSAGAFALQLIAIISGTSSGFLQDFGILNLNTTNLGEGLVIFTPNASPQESAALLSQPRENLQIFDHVHFEPFPPLHTRSRAPPSDPPFFRPQPEITPSRLPTVSTTGASLPFIISLEPFPRVSPTPQRTPIPPARSTPTPTPPRPTLPRPSNPTNLPPTPESANGTTSASFADDIVNGVLTAVGNVLVSAILNNVDLNIIVAQIIGGIKEAIGIADFYSFHLRNVCKSKVIETPDANELIKTNCTTWYNVGAELATNTRGINSSYQALTVNVTIPLLGTVGERVDSMRTLIKVMAVLDDILQFSILIGFILTALLSLLAIFRTRSRRTVGLVTILALLTCQLQAIFAINITVIIYLIPPQVNRFSKNLGVQLEHGTSILILVWVTFVLAQVAAGYWAFVWFAEVRQASIKRRMRTAAQKKMGKDMNVKAVWRELKNDLKHPKNHHGDGMEEGLVRNSRERRVTVKRELVENETPGTYVYRVTADDNDDEIQPFDMAGALRER
ncbi:hypothetical protein HYFRA_00002695 [Hymenoscyphus fraxineus]|uniref:Uncharacterized protein n=1 Tax=Hymenoscyphus fraxineus TaxID=746836 RepID=A0A9N9LCV6_9HELO|nr:hypothetical protein HYFRA_00002695 [Hymenoscyphus fraxineus]